MRSIRRAQPEDASAIGNLYRQLNTLSEPSVCPDQIARLANSDHTYLLVCDDNGELIATALVCLCQDVMFQNQPFAVVENVVVRADHQRQRVGKNLMDYIEGLCLQHNCSKIMLQTSGANRAARDFYTAIGYDPDAKIGFVKYRRNLAQQTINLENI